MAEKKLFDEIPKTAEFHSVVMTSFSFDFYHFESQVLRTLKTKGVTNINLFVDSRMLDQSIGFATGHLKSLSTSYSITGIHAKGVFHPKITLLAGDHEVMLLFGSGNITNGGHGRNHEAFSVFYATEEDSTQLPLILEAWAYLKRITKEVQGVSKEKLKWVEDNCGLLQKTIGPLHQFHTVSEVYRALLLYNDESSIWSQLKNVMPTKIEEIKVFCPFYDESGSLLLKLREQFPMASIAAFVQEGKGIHPFKLEEGAGIQFYDWDETKRGKLRDSKQEKPKLHAKLFWFKSENEEYLILGSANATVPAFGTDTARGVNDEFSVLIHVTDTDILKTLGLDGQVKSAKPQDNGLKDSVEIDGNVETERKRFLVKLNTVDLNGSRITLFYNTLDEPIKVQLVIHNSWGEILVTKMLSLTGDKTTTEIKHKNQKEIAFVTLLDEDGRLISNKQPVNNIQALWNTNPSTENRKLLKLSSMIETGTNGVFDIIDFYNTLQSNTNLGSNKKIVKKIRSENESEEESVGLSYDEAIAKEKERQDKESRLTHSNAIRIFDAIESHYKQLATKQEEGDMDDEEEGNASSSNERDEGQDKKRVFSEYLYSLKVLARRRKNIEKFFNNYDIIVEDLIAKGQILDLSEFAMFLITLRQAINFASTPLSIKKIAEGEEFDNQPLLHLKSRDMGNTSYSNIIVNTIGSFVNALWASTIEKHEEEYYTQKLEHYKKLSLMNALFSLAIVKGITTNDDEVKTRLDTLAYNILFKLGSAKDLVNKTTYAHQLEDFLILKEVYLLHCKSEVVKELTSEQLISFIKNWYEGYEELDHNPRYLVSDEFGVCRIQKFIPSIEEPKYLRLARPGFEYSEEHKEFELPELYECQTGRLISSLQSFKSQKAQQ
ncbi:MAG: hypothetical protein HWE07_14595 [Cytophagia bacterium]|nr:hypothetical protein [Cytophagia bacterium]